MLGVHETFVCTPRLIEDRSGGLAALWSAPVGSHYAVHLARMDQQGQWGEERVIWLAADADLRFAAAAFDADKRLWIAAVEITPGKSRVVVRSVGGVDGV